MRAAGFSGEGDAATRAAAPGMRTADAKRNRVMTARTPRGVRAASSPWCPIMMLAPVGSNFLKRSFDDAAGSAGSLHSGRLPPRRQPLGLLQGQTAGGPFRDTPGS